MNTQQEMRISAAVEILGDLRRQRSSIEHLPDHARPKTAAEAYVIQQRLALASAPARMYWKVSASSPNGGPVASPVFGERVLTTPASITTANRLEAEIALKLGRDLPFRPGKPYAREEVSACVEAAAIAFEIVDWRLTASDLSFPERIADCFANDGMVIGTPVPLAVLSASPVREITLFRDTMPALFNPVDIDPIGALHAYVNSGGDRLGGLKAGQWVLTGSMTGMQTFAPSSCWKAVWANKSEVRLSSGSPV